MMRAFPVLPLAALPLAVLPLLASCVAPKEVPSAPPVTSPPIVAAPPPSTGHDWTDGALTPGAWRYEVRARGSAALYAGADGGVLFAMRCAGGDVALIRGSVPFTITTTSLSRTLQPGPDGAAHLPARDAFLDAMAFSRGRLMVRAQALPTIVVPVAAEIGRVVEDCR